MICSFLTQLQFLSTIFLPFQIVHSKSAGEEEKPRATNFMDMCQMLSAGLVLRSHDSLLISVKGRGILNENILWCRKYISFSNSKINWQKSALNAGKNHCEVGTSSNITYSTKPKHVDFPSISWETMIFWHFSNRDLKFPLFETGLHGLVHMRRRVYRVAWKPKPELLHRSIKTKLKIPSGQWEIGLKCRWTVQTWEKDSRQIAGVSF